MVRIDFIEKRSFPQTVLWNISKKHSSIPQRKNYQKISNRAIFRATDAKHAHRYAQNYPQIPKTCDDKLQFCCLLILTESTEIAFLDTSLLKDGKLHTIKARYMCSMNKFL